MAKLTIKTLIILPFTVISLNQSMFILGKHCYFCGREWPSYLEETFNKGSTQISVCTIDLGIEDGRPGLSVHGTKFSRNYIGVGDSIKNAIPKSILIFFLQTTHIMYLLLKSGKVILRC